MKIPHVSHFIGQFLIIICTLYEKFQKNACLWSCWCCKIGLKWPICPNQHQRPLFEIPYIPLLSVMTLHYHRLYQISNLEANLSLEDMKQLYRQGPIHSYTYPKTNNLAWCIPTIIKNNPEHTFIFPKIPVRALYLMLQRLNSEIEHYTVGLLVLACWLLSLRLLLLPLPITFSCLQSIRDFFQN